MNETNGEGQKEGRWEEYWPSGRLWYKGYYRNDQKEGWWEKYWPNGSLDFKGHYRNGQEYGFEETENGYRFYL